MNRLFIGKEIQKGYGLGINQRGGFGFGRLFKNFLGFIKPYLTKAKEYAIPILKSGAEAVGKEVVKSSADIARDLLDGKKFQDSAKERIGSSIDNLAQMADEKLSGKGYKRKRKRVEKTKKSKKRKIDIFDEKWKKKVVTRLRRICSQKKPCKQMLKKAFGIRLFQIRVFKIII